VAEDMRNPWYLAFFVVGVLASSFHLGVGIWEFPVQVGAGGYRQGAGKRRGALAHLLELRSVSSGS